MFTPAGGSAPNLKVDDVLVYQAGSGDLRWNRITAVNSGGANFSLTATGSAVAGVYNPAVANGTYASVKLGISRIANEEKGGLYAELPDHNIASVSLTGSELMVTEQVAAKTISGNQLTISVSDFTGISSSFNCFDAERYLVSESGGGIGTVTSG